MAAAASASHEALEVLLNAAKRSLGGGGGGGGIRFLVVRRRRRRVRPDSFSLAAAAPVRSTACIELLYANEARDDSATVDGL